MLENLKARLEQVEAGETYSQEIWMANGRGASIIRNSLSAGGATGYFEVMPLDEHGELDYKTADANFGDADLGWLKPDDVVKVVEQIQNL